MWAPLLLTSQVLWEAKGSSHGEQWDKHCSAAATSHLMESSTILTLRMTSDFHISDDIWLPVQRVGRLTNLMEFKEISVPGNRKCLLSMDNKPAWCLTVFHGLPLSALLLYSAFTFSFYSYYKVGCVCCQVCQKRFWIRAEEISEVSRTAAFNSLYAGAVCNQKGFLDQPHHSWTQRSDHSFEKGISDIPHLSKYDLK